MHDLGEVEVAIGAVWNHQLARFKTELGAVEKYSDDIRFE
jgi:hypothetical protein